MGRDLTYIRPAPGVCVLGRGLDAFSRKWWDGRWTHAGGPVADRGAAAGHRPTNSRRPVWCIIPIGCAVRVRRTTPRSNVTVGHPRHLDLRLVWSPAAPNP